MVASRYCDKSEKRQDKATVIREVLAVTIETNDGHDELMQKWDLWTTIRVRSWVSRFIRNCRAKHQQRITGPITTQETSKHMKFKEKGHKSDAKVQAGFRKISNVSISKRTQMDCTNAEGVSRETTPFTFQMMLC